MPATCHGLGPARADAVADTEHAPQRESVTRRMSMPLIKARANRVRIVRHICRLQEPNRDTLVLYARFIGDTPDYVLNQLLASTLAKDRDFLAWQVDHPGEVVASAPPRSHAVAKTAGKGPKD
jgi:hypothetical protein